MRPASPIVALLLVLTASLADWAYDALYFQRDAAVHVLGALAVNALCVGALLFALQRLLSPGAFQRLACTLLVSLAAVMVYMAIRPAVGGSLSIPRPVKLGGLLLMLVGAYALVPRVRPATWGRAMRAASVAAVAYALAPIALAAWRAEHIAWPPLKPAGQGVAAAPADHTIFLLLDELGNDAAAPIASALRELGLQVQARSLQTAGADTINIIPAMFTRRDFSQAKPCGVSTICSGRALLDFSRIDASRPDIDIVGEYHPYCRITGLRHCYALRVPESYRNAYFSLANYHASRLGLPLQNADLDAAVSKGLKAQLVHDQLDALMHVPFWKRGGLLYAHLPIPHPPGMAGWQSLDSDYADNIGVARQLVHEVAQKAIARFGDKVRIIVTSDHGLRTRIWCADSAFNPYRGAPCKVRPEFASTQVPLLYARLSSNDAVAPMTNNRDVFDLLSVPAGAR